MEQHIPKSALVAEIEKLQLCTMDEHMNYYSAEAQGEYNALSKLASFLNTLEVKEFKLPNPRFPHLNNIVDKVFGTGNLESLEYEEAEQLVLLAKEELLKDLEVKEVDLEKAIDDYIYTHDGRKRLALELDWKCCNLTLKGGDEIIKFAKHFFELGMQASNKPQEENEQGSVILYGISSN